MASHSPPLHALIVPSEDYHQVTQLSIHFLDRIRIHSSNFVFYFCCFIYEMIFQFAE